ncbi:MAG TPA: flagellar basal body P-ring formation chaperone FlgA [Bryobacteraceae bacterium]|nr:flagellar basal body P-ring formation chaperone FlgA [Bryobacteraceae bacterium]
MKQALILLLAVRAFACHTVDGDSIKGKDLAAASVAFAKLDPELDIAPTPLPGVPRLLHAAELTRLARRYAIDLSEPVPEICFERATEPLTAERLYPVLRQALGIDDARIEIQDFSRAGVPRGTLEFKRSGLTDAGVWRGQVVYAEARSVPVWARVKIIVDRNWVEAVETLPAGTVIAKGQLVERRGPRFPFGPVMVDSIHQVEGQQAARAIKAGEPISASMLVHPREVTRGDRVKVMVMSGEARLQFDATAETSGRVGESVMVLNPDSGHHFLAKVEGKDEVLIKK